VKGDEEQEEQEEEIPETRIEVEIPRIMTNFGRSMYFVKLPNFLSVDTRYVQEVTASSVVLWTVCLE